MQFFFVLLASVRCQTQSAPPQHLLGTSMIWTVHPVSANGTIGSMTIDLNYVRLTASADHVWGKCAHQARYGLSSRSLCLFYVRGIDTWAWYGTRKRQARKLFSVMFRCNMQVRTWEASLMALSGDCAQESVILISRLTLWITKTKT